MKSKKYRLSLIGYIKVSGVMIGFIVLLGVQSCVSHDYWLQGRIDELNFFEKYAIVAFSAAIVVGWPAFLFPFRARSIIYLDGVGMRGPIDFFDYGLRWADIQFMTKKERVVGLGITLDGIEIVHIAKRKESPLFLTPVLTNIDIDEFIDDVQFFSGKIVENPNCDE